MRIDSAKFLLSAPDLGSCPSHDLPEFAFIGRSNVGKSSLVNMITRRGGLAKVSSTPGKTRLINLFEINGAFCLVDLPGYGYAKISKKERSRFNAQSAEYLTLRPNLRCLFVLIDSRLTPQRIDLEFLDWVDEHGIPYALVFTKSDKMKVTALEKNILTFTERLADAQTQPLASFTTSAVKGKGRAELLRFLESLG